MSDRHVKTIGFALLLVFAMTAAVNCESGGCAGCATMEPVEGGFPLEQAIENGVQIRITESGLSFIEGNAAQMMGGLLPEGMTFVVPPQCDESVVVGSFDLCGTGEQGNCVADDPPCEVQMELVSLGLSPSPPASLEVEARVNFWSLHSMQTHGSLGALDCNVDVDTRLGDQAYATAVATLELSQDPLSNRTHMKLTTIDIPEGEIENADLDISGGVDCWAVDLFFKGMIIDIVRDKIRDQTEPLMRALCDTCDATDPHCPALASCQEVEIDEDEYRQWCMEDSGEGCVQNMGTEGRLDLGLLLGGVSPGLQAFMDLHLRAGGYTEALQNGMSQGVLSGAMAHPGHDTCVPPRDPPPLTAVDRSSVFEGNRRPDNTPYMVGVGIHKSFLDRAGYALYDSGGLCLDIGPRQSDFLKVGTFAVLLDSLNDLIHNDNPALVLAIRPQNPLTFELGAGTTDGQGNILDPLLTVRSSQLAIDFYGLVDFRFVRLFRLNADLALPLNLDVNAQNELVPVLGDLATAFENVTVTHSELLSESSEEIAAVFPVLLDLVSGMLGDSFAPLVLPDLQGFRLVLSEGSVTTVEQNTILAIFADLQYVGLSDPPDPLYAPADTQARIAALDEPPPTDFRPHTIAETLADGPQLTLDVQVSNRRKGEQVAYSYRLDGGLWSPFVRTTPLVITRPLLWLKGQHTVEVRARFVGLPQTVDPTPARLTFTVGRDASSCAIASGEDHTVSLYGRVSATGAGCECRSAPGKDHHRRLGALWWSLMGLLLAFWLGRAAADKDGRNKDGRNKGGRNKDGRNKGGRNKDSRNKGGRNKDSRNKGGRNKDSRNKGGRNKGGRNKDGRNRRRSIFALAVVGAAGLASILGGFGCDGKSSGGCGDATDIPLVCAEPLPECERYEELVGLEPMTLDPDTCQPVPVPCECHADPVDPGDYGRFLSAAASQDGLLIACYSDRWGDLNVVQSDGEGTLIPEAVDGVPFDTPVGADPEGFRAGITRRGDDVGHFTDIAVGSDGQARISYTEVDDGGLKYAQGTPGQWQTHYLLDPETKPETEQVTHTALILDENDVPHLFFTVSGVQDATHTGRFSSELRLAEASGPNPAAAADWDIAVVDATRIPCGGYCEDDEICLADGWTCVAEDDNCSDCLETQGCYSAMCVDIVTAPTWTDHPEGVGLFPSAGWTGDGRLVVAYHNRTAGTAKIAARTNDTWQVHTIEGDAATDVGLYTSLIIDETDTIHLVFHDAVQNSLIYHQLSADLNPLMRQIIDDGVRPDGQHVVGLDPILYFDADARPAVFYQDGTTADLMHAARSATDNWTVSSFLFGDPGYGFFPEVVRDSNGTFWLVQYVYDRAAEPFGGLRVQTVP
jgi:hypothetical protein